jgi:hypothetical protein
MAALRAFGAPLGELVERDLVMAGTGFKMGQPPRRIDILTAVDGVRFDDAWANRIDVAFGAVRCGVIGLADLLANKRASGRPQDLADVDALERLARLTRK